MSNILFRGLGGGIDMYFWWQIIVIIDFAFITLLIPFGIIFYRTDENKSMVRRREIKSIYIYKFNRE